jgi:hypothetical protein
VHTAVNALNSPLGVFIRIPGILPNRKIFPLFCFDSSYVPAITEVVIGSEDFGGIKYFTTGYITVKANAVRLPPRKYFRKFLRDERNIFLFLEFTLLNFIS